MTEQADYITDAREMAGKGYEREERASLAALGGKYYGTFVIFDSGMDVHHIKIWINDGDAPSARQLVDWNMTIDEARADGMMSDSHYETELTYQAAVNMVDFLNSR